MHAIAYQLQILDGLINHHDESTLKPTPQCPQI